MITYINNLQLAREDIFKKLSSKKNNLNIDTLISQISLTNTLTKEILKPLVNGELNGNERNDSLGNINPLHWELGHVLYFWIENTIKLLNFPINKSFDNSYIFDSFRTDRESRFNSILSNEIKPIHEIIKMYDDMIVNLIVKLFQIKSNNTKLDADKSYLIQLSLLHNHMHLESFCFTLQLLKQTKPKVENLFNSVSKSFDSIENSFLKIKGSSFTQGWNDTTDNFTFDNERPSFQVIVNDFSVSKYPVTQGQYLKFIHSGGYENERYWCPEGWRWRMKNKIKLPMYWEYISSITKIMKLKWGVFEEINLNEPICHISWYEANAYCRWANCRLPTESEWEYLATNGGTTKYPWGNDKPSDKLANLNYHYDGLVSVNEYSDGNNKDGVQQLFGNVWEWCQEPIYPYNGFEIDPVYREMSYPFFGFKKICRGGAWCVPDYLINSKYRNAQTPDCRMQYIGFRVCI